MQALAEVEDDAADSVEAVAEQAVQGLAETFFTGMGCSASRASPARWLQAKASASSAISFSMRSGAVRCVSSKRKPPVFKAPNRDSVSPLRAYPASASVAGTPEEAMNSHSLSGRR